MNPHFAEVTEKLAPLFQRLLSMKPFTPVSLPQKMPREGVYLFSEDQEHLYVGRSKDIRKRIARHCRPGATHRMAAFAFRLAREATGYLDASYKKEGSRSELMKDPAFRDAFDKAKTRIQEMDVRFVEESDSIRQALLEIYVAVSLRTPYNDFGTH
jgi:hypothetical protein